MDKKRILENLLDEMRAKLSVLIQSAHAARQEATHEDTKAENKYDTRAIEAGYLAGAQAERVAQLQATISFFERLELKPFDSRTPIEMTALLELKSDGKITWNFLLPQGGGMKVYQGDRDVFILGVQAPLGIAVIGKIQGDVLEVTTQSGVKEYEILRVL
jgi:transcription elongation GreA/GreB family factor